VFEGLFLIENSADSTDSILVTIAGVEITISPGEAFEANPRALKEIALLRLEPYADESKQVSHAVRGISKILDSKLWLDGSHLHPKKGDEVFDQERRRVIRELLHALRDTEKGKKDALSPEAAQAAMVTINYLVQADRLLALIKIGEVRASLTLDDVETRVEKELAKAEEELAKGDVDRDSGAPDKAVQHYGKSWRHAVRAMDHYVRAMDHDAKEGNGRDKDEHDDAREGNGRDRDEDDDAREGNSKDKDEHDDDD
ncbi:MAG: hypothetical protein O2812_01220, partial [Chloroflexi bacterium]|nr:hypothetical protein [Chloroflexota bacterium]